MPQNPLEILRGLAMRNVPKPTLQEEENRDFRARAIQNEEPAWKSVGRNLVDATTSFVGGDPFKEGVDEESMGSKLGMLAASAPMIPRRLPIIAPEAYDHVKAGGLKLYSRLTDAFAKAPSTMKPAKAIDIARQGASKEEIATRKLAEFLKGKQPMADIPRQEIMDHLSQNPLELDIVRKGYAGVGDVTNQTPQQAYDRFIHELDTEYGNGWDVTNINPEQRARLQQLEDARFTEDGLASEADKARYDYLQTPGPKENYGETLINLPKGPNTKRIEAIQNELNQARSNDIDTYESQRNYRTGLMEEMDELEHEPIFQTSHWDEPNNLVWSRHNDRRLEPMQPTGKNIYGMDLAEVEDTYRRAAMQTPPQTEALNPIGPKGRFIEEIQSDWHQQGREQGYKTPDIEDRYKAAGEEVQRLRTSRIPEEYPSVEAWDAARNDAIARETELHNTRIYGVPDAPFKDTYHELALKQQLLDAANDPELEWLGVADADTVSAMEGHTSVRPGTDLFYNEKHPSALRKLLEPLGGEVEKSSLPVTPSKLYYENRPDSPNYPQAGMWKANLTPELKELIKQRGFPAMLALLGLQQSVEPNRPQE